MYNHYGTLDDGNVLIYNVLSSAVAIMTQSEFSAIQNDEPAKGEENLFTDSLGMGFLVPTSEDEVAKVLTLRNANNFNDRRAGFQILPTTGCNARCFYCYEKGFTVSTMTNETIEATIQFILNYCETIQDVTIAWFGGEPFTEETTMARISKALIDEFDKRGTRYSANVITNGALISEENIDAIASEYRISSVQITLDGRGDNHVRRKKYLDKTVTYETILKNIALLTKHDIQVMVRINADKRNFKDCLAIFDDLINLNANFVYLWPYVAPLYSDNKNYTDCFTQNELSDVFCKVYKKMIDTGFIKTIDGLPMNFSNATCCAKMMNNFVISPEGDISKCEHLLNNPDEVIGHVSTGITFNSAMAKWCDANIPEKCKSCSYLPICQAGCSAAETRGFGYGRCSFISFVDNAIIEAANYLLKKGEVQ